MVKYTAQVVAIGPLVGEFTASGVLVFFRQGAPEEVAEFSVLHDGQDTQAPIAPGDQLLLGDESFRILAVGDVANPNLAALGHLVVKFNGQETPELPGDVCVEARPLPRISTGMTVQIVG